MQLQNEAQKSGKHFLKCLLPQRLPPCVSACLLLCLYLWWAVTRHEEWNQRERRVPTSSIKSHFSSSGCRTDELLPRGTVRRPSVCSHESLLLLQCGSLFNQTCTQWELSQYKLIIKVTFVVLWAVVSDLLIIKVWWIYSFWQTL